MYQLIKGEREKERERTERDFQNQAKQLTGFKSLNLDHCWNKLNMRELFKKVLK